MEENTKTIMTVDNIRNKVYSMRGQQVMLDADLAEIYGYEVKALNQQVKRNEDRFPEDFMFRLKKTELEELRSQKKQGVEVILFTENGHGRKGFLTSAVINDFIDQYPPLRIKPNPDCHDRWIVLDYGLSTEQAYIKYKRAPSLRITP